MSAGVHDPGQEAAGDCLTTARCVEAVASTALRCVVSSHVQQRNLLRLFSIPCLHRPPLAVSCCDRSFLGVAPPSQRRFPVGTARTDTQSRSLPEPPAIEGQETYHCGALDDWRHAEHHGQRQQFGWQFG